MKLTKDVLWPEIGLVAHLHAGVDIVSYVWLDLVG